MKHLLFLLIILILSACSDSKKSGKGNNSSNNNNGTQPQSFSIGKILFKVEPVKEESYNKFKNTEEPFDTSEARNIERDSIWVERNGDTLSVITEKGPVVIVNNHSDGDDFSRYKYLYFDKRINQYVIEGSYWEAYGYVFVDKVTGVKIHSIGLPTVSPNGKYILTGNCDLVAGYNFNSIAIYKMSTSPELMDQKKPIPGGLKILNGLMILPYMQKLVYLIQVVHH